MFLSVGHVSLLLPILCGLLSKILHLEKQPPHLVSQTGYVPGKTNTIQSSIKSSRVFSDAASSLGLCVPPSPLSHIDGCFKCLKFL